MKNEKLLKRENLIQVDVLKMLRVDFDIQRIYFSGWWTNQESIDPCTISTTTTTMASCFLLASRASRILFFSSIGLVVAGIIGAFLWVFDVLHECIHALNNEVENENAKCELECELDCNGFSLSTDDTIDTTADLSQAVFVFNNLGLLMGERNVGGYDPGAAVLTIVVTEEVIKIGYDFNSGSLSSSTSRATSTGIAESCIGLDGNLFLDFRWTFNVYWSCKRMSW